MSALVGKRPRTSAHSDHPVGRRASGVGGCLRGACRGASATSSAESRNEGDPALRRPLPPSVQSRGSSARLEAVAQRPLFRVGLFADAQFADRPDKRRVSSEPTRTKFFRAAETRLAATLQTFGAQASSLACVVNLGDIYDGANDDGLSSAGPVLRPASGVAPELADSNRADLARMVKILRENDPGVPVYHCLGNHDLNLPRQEVVEALRSPAPYFSASLPRGWRLVVLDTTDLNPRYLMPGSEGHSEGLAFFEAAAPSRLLTPWGGGIGSEQMDWLRGTLEEAERNGQRVLVASHCALHPGAAREGFCAWNAEEVAELLEASKAVAICVAGHDHTGGYYTSSGLTHFVTLEAMLEAPQGSNAFCFLEVWPHHVEVRGVGAATSRRLQVTPMQKFSGIAGFGMRIESILGSDNIHMWP